MRLTTLLAGLVTTITFARGQSANATSQYGTIRRDPLADDPDLEVVHLYTGQWPTGIAVSSTGRKFSCFPAGLDFLNTNNGLNGAIQVAELTGLDTQVAYPNVSYNNPPGGSVNRLAIPAVTQGYSNYLLGVQSVVVDSQDTLWILDTGRVQDLSNLASPILPASPGGTKLISVNLKTDTVTRTYVFPPDVALPDSYFNDVRFDHARGYAYISDSSLTGHNAIVVLDLASGHAFRTLAQPASQTHPIAKSVPFVYGQPMYQVASATQALHAGYITFGADGIAISPDARTLYFSAIAGRFLYSVPTALLRSANASSAAQAAALAAVANLGEKGISDGLETDSAGIVYAGNAEQGAIAMYDPASGFATLFTRDPRINWVDTMSIAADGYLYFTVNQLNYLNAIYPGTGLPLVDRRQKPYVAFRKKLPGLATKIG